jgi:hypothetical protein
MRMKGLPAISVALFCVMLFTAGPLSSVELYGSNAVGIQGDRLEPGDSDMPEYVLEVSADGSSEVRRLLHEGVEIRRVETLRDGTTVTERTYEEDLLQRETIRRDDGTFLREALFSDGEFIELWEFIYEGELLVAREVVGPGDVLMYRETYSYWRDGTLRAIVKEEGSQVRTEYRYRDGRLEEEWVSRPGEAERFEFDSGGRLVIRELHVGDELAEQEVRLYWAADSASVLKEVVVSEGDRITRRGYDERGRLTSEQVEESGRIIRELTRVFAEDLLVREVETDSRGQRSWEYAYTEEGERERETYREDGELVEVTHLVLAADQAPADRMVELFNRGQAVLRVYYEGQTRTREEVIRDGEVIRTREFAQNAAADNEEDRDQ